MIFFRWDLKTLFVKNSECKSQGKKEKKKDSVYISLFSMVYTPPYPQLFFLYLVARGWEYFKFLGNLLYCGVLISFLGEGG